MCAFYQGNIIAEFNGALFQVIDRCFSPGSESDSAIVNINIGRQCARKIPVLVHIDITYIQLVAQRAADFRF